MPEYDSIDSKDNGRQENRHYMFIHVSFQMHQIMILINLSRVSVNTYKLY